MAHQQGYTRLSTTPNQSNDDPAEAHSNKNDRLRARRDRMLKEEAARKDLAERITSKVRKTIDPLCLRVAVTVRVAISIRPMNIDPPRK